MIHTLTEKLKKRQEGTWEVHFAALCEIFNVTVAAVLSPA